MIKVIPAGLPDAEPPALVKVSSRGLIGVDRASLLKRSSAGLLDRIDRIDCRPGENLIHLIALGATEHYGPNRNGDGFSAAACRQHHDTFCKYAFFYREHCFVAGTKVVMANRVRMPIESIGEGDMVATREGDKKVLRVMQEDYLGDGVCIRLEGSLNSVTVTGEHPVLVVRRDELHCRHKYCCLTDGDHQQQCVPCRKLRADVSPKYVPAGSVEGGDYVLIHRPAAGTEAVSPEFAELVGWVASEGHIPESSSVIAFTFSSKNVADLQAVEKCLLANGCQKVTKRVRKDGLTGLTCSRRELADRVSKYVWGVKTEKRLSGDLLRWDRASLLRFMGSYIDGDGHVSTNGRLRIRSCSPHMLTGLADIIHALGSPTRIVWDTPVGQEVWASGKMYIGNGSGVVVVSGHFAGDVCEHSRKKKTYTGRRSQTVDIQGCFLRQVASVENVTIDEPVYNLEVEDAHHYFAEEMVVHNCNADPLKSYGIVKASLFNEDMQRIELLVALNGTAEAAKRNKGLVADKEMEKLANNDQIAVSMSCRVPNDVCNCCGNKARNRSEYCRGFDEGGSCPGGGAFRKLGTVTADGTQLYVDNPQPTFFDISNVHRPADRTAYASGVVKAASFQKLVGGAELAERYGLTDAPFAARPDDRVWPLLRKLAGVEDRLAGTRHTDNLAFSAAVRSPVAWASVPFGPLLKAAAARHVLLPLDGFVAAAGGSPADAAAAAATLPSVFRELVASRPVKLAAAVAVSAPALYGDPAATRLADAAAVDYSLAPTAVDRRVLLASLYGSPSALRAPAKTASTGGRDTAAAYAAYQLATLLATRQDEFFCELVIRHNGM
jgi:hypothetical protein